MSALVFNRSSQVYISKSWASYSFSARAARVETSYPTLNYTTVFTYLPQINFDSFKIKILSPLYFSFSSSFNSWQYGSDKQYSTNTQARSREFGFSPVLSLPFNSIRWLSVNLSLEGNLNYYWRSIGSKGGIVDEPLLTKNFAFNVDFVGPVFYRIWDLGGNEGGDGSSKALLKHVFEPGISYHYESPIINGARVIRPYGFYRYHQIVYGFTNHVLLKKGGTPKEISWGVSQAFYLAPEDGPNRYYPINGVIPRFSEVSSYIRLYPAAGFSFDFATSFNTYFKGFSSIRLAANLGSPADNLYLNVSWYKSKFLYYNYPLADRHQLSLFSRLKIPALSLDLRGEMDFNIAEMKMLFSAVSAVYHYQCLDFKADVRLYFFREKPDIQFKISFGLGNIGKTTDFLGGARFD